MSVLIEGIETEEHLTNALEDGCANAQGFCLERLCLLISLLTSSRDSKAIEECLNCSNQLNFAENITHRVCC